MFCIALSMDPVYFVCCMFVNCLVKQFAICLGVCYFVVECDGVVVCG